MSEESNAQRKAPGDTAESLAENFEVRSIIESLPMPAFLVDADHTLIRYNYGFAKLGGVDSEELLGEDYRDVTTEVIYTDKRRELSLCNKVVKEPRTAHEVYDVKRADMENPYTNSIVYQDSSTILNRRGEEVDVVFVAMPLFDNEDELQGVLELVQENERELEEFPGLAGILSHDLRNPLDVIETYTSLSEEEMESEYFQAIQRNIKRMERIMEDALALAEHANTTLEIESVSLEEIAHEAWDHVHTEEATLVTEDRQVKADPECIVQVFENLFRNAIQHGGTDVEVRVCPAEEGVFFVEDDGPGIPEEIRDDVFKHGFTTGSQGTGFGLSIVDKLVSDRGWEIQVKEGSDGGARFLVSDPYEGRRTDTTVDTEA